MTTAKIRLKSEVDLAIDDVVAGISELETADLEQFLQKIGRLIARRKASSVSDKETVLLKAINKNIPSTLQNRYVILSQKLHEETLSEVEHKELLSIIEIIEAQKVERLRNLIELSQLRNISLDSLMDELNLNYHG